MEYEVVRTIKGTVSIPSIQVCISNLTLYLMEIIILKVSIPSIQVCISNRPTKFTQKVLENWSQSLLFRSVFPTELLDYTRKGWLVMSQSLLFRSVFPTKYIIIDTEFLQVFVSIPSIQVCISNGGIMITKHVKPTSQSLLFRSVFPTYSFSAEKASSN